LLFIVIGYLTVFFQTSSNPTYFASFFAGGSLHAQKPFTVQQRWTIGGDGSWDYMTVDSAARRLYIAHQTRVQVVNLDTGKLVGAIESLTRCHGIVIAPGQMLVSAITPSDEEFDENDPVLEAFLAFLAKDMEDHPEQIKPLSASRMKRIAELTKGVVVDFDEDLGDEALI